MQYAGAVCIRMILAQLEFAFDALDGDIDADEFLEMEMATGGTVLFVPRNVEVSVPLYSLINQNAAGGAEFTSVPLSCWSGRARGCVTSSFRTGT